MGGFLVAIDAGDTFASAMLLPDQKKYVRSWQTGDDLHDMYRVSTNGNLHVVIDPVGPMHDPDILSRYPVAKNVGMRLRAPPHKLRLPSLQG